jgi:SOS-response transcriptional repressor LexA
MMLTKKQKQIYDYVEGYIKEHSIAPTVREVADHHKTVPSNAKRYLDALHTEGWINKSIMKTRGFVLGPTTKKPIQYLASPYSFGGDSSEEDRNENYRMAVRQAWEMMSEGINVYSPIVHHHPIQKVEPMVMVTDDWMQFDLPFLEVAQTLYVLCTPSWQLSEGVMAEIDYAKDRGKPIEYITPSQFVLTGEDVVEF